MNYYTNEQITPHCLMVVERFPGDQNGQTMGLVLGSEKAAMIDSSWGVIGNLREYVQSLTSLPIFCILTHPHPDHAGAAVQFDEVYMNPTDASILEWSLSKEKRLSDVADKHKDDYELLEEMRRQVTDCSQFCFSDLRDGQVFDLGGVTLEAMVLPGHTAGSVVLFCREDNVVFVGDAVGKKVMLVGEGPEPDVPIPVYRDALKKFYEKCDAETKIINGHTAEILNRNLVADLIRICDRALDSSVQPESQDVPPRLRRKFPSGFANAVSGDQACVVYGDPLGSCQAG